MVELMDVKGVAKLLKCSVRHVYRQEEIGRMPPFVKLGQLVRWPRKTGDPSTGIEDWIKAGCPDLRRSKNA